MRTTLTINDKLYKIVKRNALDEGISVSDYIQKELTYTVLEDAEDLDEITRRQNEPTITHKELMRQFKAEGLL